MAAGGEVVSRRGGVSTGFIVRSRRLVVVGGLVAALTSALAGMPVLWLLTTVFTLAASGRAGLRGAVERLPVTGVLVIAGAGMATLVAGLLGLDVMSSPWTARLLLAGLVVALVAAAVVTGHGDEWPGARSWTELGLSIAPAGLMVVIGALLALSPLGARTSWFLSGDHVRHLGLVTRTVDAGSLEYVTQTYPRGWHGALALLWSTTGFERDRHGLAALIHLQSLATWFVLALLPLALALTASALHRAGGGRPVASGAAGAAAGTLVLGPWFFGDYVPRGFETSLFGLLVLASAVLRVTQSRADTGALAVVAGSGALVAHVWPVLLPAVGALLLVVLRDRWRTRPSARDLTADASLLVLATALGAPALLGALRGYGLDAVGVAGDVPPPVLGWVAVAVASAVALVVVGTGSLAVACLACAGTTLATALGLAALGGVGLESYYPSKTLWTAAALGLPLIGAAGAHLFTRLQGRGSQGRPLLVVCGLLAGCVLLLSAATPAMGVSGSWSAADGRVVVDTVTSEGARSAAVVWGVGTETDDATSQLLLDFYGARATSAPLGLAPRELDEQCALLLQAREPVVMSDAPESQVLERFTCAPGVRVVSVGAPS